VEIRLVSRSDYDEAVRSLTEQLRAELAAWLDDPNDLPEGLTLFPQTTALADPVPDMPAEALVDTEADGFDLTMNAQATVTAVDEAPIEAIARGRLLDGVPADRAVFPDSISVEVRTRRVSGERVSYRAEATARDWMPTDAESLLERIRGLRLADARAVLEPYGSVRIDVWPGYVDAIPTLEGRATLTVLEPEAAA
jgi:hypothetical protein